MAEFPLATISEIFRARSNYIYVLHDQITLHSTTMLAPTRRITTQKDLEIWKQSQTFTELLTFIKVLQELVYGLTNDAEVKESSIVTKLQKLVDHIESIANRNPVQQDKNSSRFGKVEFRDFYDDVKDHSAEIITELSSTIEPQNLIELQTYLTESFGNRTRIDYGSGHELNFICFLFCLDKLGILQEADYSALILKVFTRYIAVMRHLQKEYWLEPAGSHGKWGLDDYHFLPFLFGASQLAPHPYMKPKLIHNEELVEELYTKYMYLECVQFVNVIKSNPMNGGQKLSLRMHSPMLDDILAAKSWKKIKEGMVKLYEADVLGKLPIMQHLMFGELIKCPDEIETSEVAEDEHGHVHTYDAANTWGDCCGIRLPSAYAAAESNKPRPVPFD